MRLYPYQEKVKGLIQQGRSVILLAPTGTGKTRAAISPFIEGFFDFPVEQFPKKCFYCVPMRVLAQQFLTEYKGYAERYQRKFQNQLRVTIQTGDQPEDPSFEKGDLIFCTIDQALSSFLTMPYSLGAGKANMNAGAMVGAYIIVDEFHLLDPQSTLPSTLYAMRQLSYLAPVLLMTATFSKPMLDVLAEWLNAEVVIPPMEEIQLIQTARGKRPVRERVWQIAETAMTAEAILSGHKKRSLAICNTVGRAQNLFRELTNQVETLGSDIKVLLLHSRFLTADRRKKESELKTYFGEGAGSQESWIAVATQTIEVGVDITCEMLHTELAPASALIQRAGRCARYPGERGNVWVYPVDNFAPYGSRKDEESAGATWVQEMRAVFTWLQQHRGETFDFSKEQEMVNAVAARRDALIMQNLEFSMPTIVGKINKVLRGERQGNEARILIRDADSYLVLIHPDPDKLLGNPFGATGFHLPLNTLFGMVNEWLGRNEDLDWRVMGLMPDPEADVDEEEYGWLPLNHLSQLPAVAVLAVNPALAGYTPEEGFVADRGGTGFCSAIQTEKIGGASPERYIYALEPYEEHVRRVLESFREIILPEIRFPAQAIEKAAGWATGSLSEAAWLVCLLHDVGKLRKDWQKWARAYQQAVERPVPGSFALAHTDFDYRDVKCVDAQKSIRKRYPKPHHAAEGALATSGVLLETLKNKELVRAALTAIARHHAPFAESCQSYELETQAEKHILDTLNYLPIELRQKINLRRLLKGVHTAPPDFGTLIIPPEQLYGWLAYLVLARTLRRSDQEGTRRGTIEKMKGGF